MQRDIINYDITGIKNSLHNKLDTTYKGEMYIYKLLIIIIVYYYTYLSRVTHRVTFHFFLFSFFFLFVFLYKTIPNNNCKADLYESFSSKIFAPRFTLQPSYLNPHTNPPKTQTWSNCSVLFSIAHFWRERERESERVKERERE